MFPVEFRADVNHQETRAMGLSSSEDRMIVAGVVLAWYQRVTDGRTDGRTESIMANTALCIASYSMLTRKGLYILQRVHSLWSVHSRGTARLAMAFACHVYLRLATFDW